MYIIIFIYYICVHLGVCVYIHIQTYINICIYNVNKPSSYMRLFMINRFYSTIWNKKKTWFSIYPEWFSSYHMPQNELILNPECSFVLVYMLRRFTYVEQMTKTRHTVAFLPPNLPLLLPAGFLPLLLADPISDVRSGYLERSRRADSGNLKGSSSEITLG